VFSDRGAASPRGASSHHRRRPEGGPFRREGGREGDSRIVPSVLIEPRLQEDRGGHAVDEFAPFARRNTTLSQASRRFYRREAFVDQLDIAAARISERLGEAPRAGRLASFLTLAIEGETHEKPFDPFGRREPNELGDDPARLPASKCGSRMRNHAELVGHSQPDAYLSQIDGRHTHPAAPTL
jgi:hypothetical protein